MSSGAEPRENVEVAAELITIAEARERVLAAVSPLASESVPLLDALDRVLTREVQAANDTPPFACSAMDGYAVKAGEADRELEVVGESRAGHPATLTLEDGQAIRISTGAAVPAGAEAIVRQEDVERRDGRIVSRVVVAAGEHVRLAGEDMRSGTQVLPAGTWLGPAELGAAAAAGAGELEVARRPRVSVLCTGDELREPGAPLGPGEIHNSNAPMLVGLARRAGGEAAEAQRLADDRALTASALAQALASSDVVLISGGVSVGPHDHVKPALAELGVEERFWGVSLQPGKPTWFGTLGDTLVFGLPGNPVSSFVTFVLFAAPAFAALQGRRRDRARRHAVLGAPAARNRNREQAIRVRLEDRDGRLVAFPTGPQGSHIITSLLGADALALLPAGAGVAADGETVELLELDG
jgi:molybdopterin molybdotransferase